MCLLKNASHAASGTRDAVSSRVGDDGLVERYILIELYIDGVEHVPREDVIPAVRVLTSLESLR